MTREEAIHCLSVHSSTNGSGLCTDEQHYEAKQMAIRALEQEPCEDAISRLDMLDAIGHGTTYTSEELQGIIKALQPVNAQQWETCFDCPLSHGCPKIKGCINEQAIEYASEMPNDCPLSAQPKRKTDGDTISRQAAIDCLTATNLKKYDFILDARDKIKNLPLLTPQPKTGHWKAKSFHELFCDNCGFDFDIMRNDFIDKMNYCPNCGSKMVELQESEVQDADSD